MSMNDQIFLLKYAGIIGLNKSAITEKIISQFFSFFLLASKAK
jgi:hypothetical protein